jgi:hypothetical protein
MSDNSQSAAPNTENTSRIGIPIATKRPCSPAWQCTLDAFWLQPAGHVGAPCSGTRAAAQIAMAALQHGENRSKSCTPPPRHKKVTFREDFQRGEINNKRIINILPDDSGGRSVSADVASS